MRCSQCGGEYLPMHDKLELTDRYVGPYSVESVDYSQCEECGKRLFPLETARRIEEKRELVLQERIQSFPIKDFVTGVEAARILGITRQALHKNRRIRRGFIFQTRFSDKAVFLRKSVELFKKTGDGRFPLVETCLQVDSVERTLASYGLFGSPLVDSDLYLESGTSIAVATYASTQDEITFQRKPSNVIPLRATATDSEVSLPDTETELRNYA